MLGAGIIQLNAIETAPILKDTADINQRDKIL